MLNKNVEWKCKQENIHSLFLTSIQSINIYHTAYLPRRAADVFLHSSLMALSIFHFYSPLGGPEGPGL